MESSCSVVLSIPSARLRRHAERPELFEPCDQVLQTPPAPTEPPAPERHVEVRINERSCAYAHASINLLGHFMGEIDRLGNCRLA
jgi:hypothetical protein